MMRQRQVNAHGVRFSIVIGHEEIGHAYVYFFQNDHGRSAYLEDVFVEEDERGKGYGEQLVSAAVDEARDRGAAKLIATSRFGRDRLHAWYERQGFRKHGVCLRVDFKQEGM